jgi:hypothetical protein
MGSNYKREGINTVKYADMYACSIYSGEEGHIQGVGRET